MSEIPPFRLERLDHLVLRTTDVERLVSFYGMLGGRVVRKVDGMNLVQMAVGSSMLDIVEGSEPPAADGRNLDHFALRVEPFDREAILAWCGARNIPAEAPEFLLLGADGIGPAVYIEDPDGNRVELKGPPRQPRPDAGPEGHS